MKHRYFSSLAAVGLAALFYGPSPAVAQPYLGANLSPFAVLAGSAITCTGPGVVTGDMGINPNGASSITGFPVPCTVTGTTHAADGVALAAQNELTTAFTTLGAQACTQDLTGQDLGGLTLTPGVYCFSTSGQLTGNLTLNAQSNPNAAWIFRTGSTLTTAPASRVQFINGGNPCNVQWRVGTSATLNTTTVFLGNILAQSSISLENGATINGRALARTGAVTLIGNNIANLDAVCSAATAPPPFPAPVPTLPQIGAWALLVALLGSGAYLLSRRTRTEASR